MKELVERKVKLDETRERLLQIYEVMAQAYCTAPPKQAWQHWHDMMMHHSAELMALGGVVALKEFIQCAVVVKERLMIETETGDNAPAIGMAGLSAMLNREGEVQ